MIENICLSFNENESLIGVISESSNKVRRSDLCLIMLNAGTIHRAGPNNMYVKLSQNRSIMGIITVRCDLPGIGDSDYLKDIYDNSYLSEIKKIADYIYNKKKAKKIYILGFCTSAYYALKYANIDNRIKGLILVNGTYFPQNEYEELLMLASKRIKLRYYKQKIFSISKWHVLINGKLNLKQKINNIILREPSDSTNKTSKIQLSNDLINHEKVIENVLNNKLLRVIMYYSQGSITYDHLYYSFNDLIKKKLHQNNFSFKFFKRIDHSFTPCWAQYLLIKEISNWISK